MAIAIQIGDHVMVSRGWYSHHGIYVGGYEVVHFSGGLGPKNKLNALIRKDHIDDFAEGAVVQVKEHNTSLSGWDVAQRALSRIGEDGYDLFQNNCEHFVNWCMSGQPRSKQVEIATGVGLFAFLGGLLWWLGSNENRKDS